MTAADGHADSNGAAGRRSGRSRKNRGSPPDDRVSDHDGGQSGAPAPPVVVPVPAPRPEAGTAAADAAAASDGAAAEAPVAAAASLPAAAAESQFLDAACAGDEAPAVLATVRELLSQFVPAVATVTLSIGNQTLTTMFVGRSLGARALAQYSLGCSVFNVTGLSVCYGLAASLETLAPQLHGAGGCGAAMGTLLVRSVLLCLLACLPIALFFCFGEPALRALFTPELVPGMHEFLRWSATTLVFQAITNCLRRVLQGQRAANLTVWGAVAGAVLCPFANVALTHHGLWAAAVTLTLCAATEAAVDYALAAGSARVGFVSRRGALRFHPSHVFDRERVLDFLRIGVPAFLSLIAVWWAYEFFVVLASRQGPVAVSLYAINTSILIALYTPPSGMSTAIAVVLGNALGAGRAQAARRIAAVGFAAAVAVTAVDVFFFWAAAPRLYRVYTTDREVLAALAGLWWAPLAVHLLDGLQCAVRGLFKGTGLQMSSFRIVSAALWGVGVPVTAAATFYLDTGVLGIYCGFLLALSAMVAALLVATRSWDWEALAATAVERSRQKQAAAAVSVRHEEGSSESIDEDAAVAHCAAAAAASVRCPLLSGEGRSAAYGAAGCGSGAVVAAPACCPMAAELAAAGGLAPKCQCPLLSDV